MKKLFISQPMKGKTPEEIKAVREEIVNSVKNQLQEPIEEIDSYFEEYNPDNGCIPLKYLSKSLELLADADIVYFASGWEKTRGCIIEHECAVAYGIKIFEDTQNKKIQIKYFTPDIDKIEKIEQGDWIDLRAAEDVELKAGDFTLIPLGVGMILPDGYEAHIVPRSSTYKKFGVIQTNHMGVIDQSYCGEEDQWRFPAYALRDTVIHKNDRICQFRIMAKQEEIEFEEVEHLKEDSRGGFGSTGVQ